MNLRCPNGTGLPCFVKGGLVSVPFYGLCSKNSKLQPLFDGSQWLRNTVAVQMCSFINLLEQKVFEKQPTVGVEKKVFCQQNSTWLSSRFITKRLCSSRESLDLNAVA